MEHFFGGTRRPEQKNNGMVLCDLGIQDTGNPWEIPCMLMFLSTRPDIIGPKQFWMSRQWFVVHSIP